MFSSLICLYLFFLYISFGTFFGQDIAPANQRGVKQCNQNMESDILRQHGLALSPWPSKPSNPTEIPSIYWQKSTFCSKMLRKIFTRKTWILLSITYLCPSYLAAKYCKSVRISLLPMLYQCPNFFVRKVVITKSSHHSYGIFNESQRKNDSKIWI